MAKYSNVHIRKLLNDSDTAPTVDAKGDILEQLTVYLFDKVPGVRFHKKNVFDGVRAHELDVVFKNDKRISDLYFLDFVIIAECKNTANRLGSGGVRWFIDKLRDCGVSTGILISLSGITGVADGVSNAHSEVINAVIRDKVSVLLLSRTEIEDLKNTDELVNLLQDKILSLTIERTVL
ncbi:MAG TPA: hypothetical protein PLL09_00560 [Flavobacterium sp.]|uniref:hypothetical protein n=1 Tax=unclassified Flavobacterium TaxID=196869 RepID=UPI000E8C6243|nr:MULTISPECIES: hypothetical protein [unclassified Flavobacterium]HBI01237.1 hypothetical protein [Flavobacterium sp.]HRE76291.1 hypothetical protein [Flavobacterium sp.]